MVTATAKAEKVRRTVRKIVVRCNRAVMAFATLSSQRVASVAVPIAAVVPLTVATAFATPLWGKAARHVRKTAEDVHTAEMACVAPVLGKIP
jgi:hypothetical protein